MERVFQIIKNRRDRALDKRAALLATLWKDDEFLALDNAIGEREVRLVREANPERELALIAEIADCKEKRRLRLLTLGYTEDALLPKFTCPHCMDTGRQGKEPCVCAEDLRIALTLEENPDLKHLPCRYDEIDFSFYGERAEYFRKRYEYLNKELQEGKNFFLLHGCVGTGKTRLAATMLNLALRERRQTVLMMNAIKLGKLFLKYHLASIEEKEDVLRRVYECDILLVDDFGVEQILNNVTVPYFYELLIERREKKTVFTTNLEPMQIEERYGQRIFSRLLERSRVEWIKVDGADLRLR